MSSLACDTPFDCDGTAWSLDEEVDAVVELVGRMATVIDGGSLGKGRCASIPTEVCLFVVSADESRPSSDCDAS
jgi:hypothetical protein